MCFIYIIQFTAQVYVLLIHLFINPMHKKNDVQQQRVVKKKRSTGSLP